MTEDLSMTSHTSEHRPYVGQVPSGFDLKCRYCDWRPNDTISLGLANAHFSTEPDHGDGSVLFDLVVICRCGKVMVHEQEIRAGRHRYGCAAPCYRTRFVTQRT